MNKHLQLLMHDDVILILELFVAVLANKIYRVWSCILLYLHWVVVFMMSSGRTEQFLIGNRLW